MTGFGTAAGRVGPAQVTVELRTVNHRFFNPSIKLPSSLARYEGEVREALRRAVARGHITVSARVERPVADTGSGGGIGGGAVNERRFGECVEQLRSLQLRHGLADTLDVATVLRLPDVLVSDQIDVQDAVHGGEELVAIVNHALDALMRMREEEGARLASLLGERIDEVRQTVERLAMRAPERLIVERERLRRSVRELADGIELDEQRLVQELALLADKLDVSEEVDRFRSHLTAFRAALDADRSEPVGKRLGFLLQEMLRETNTLGSKARDAIMLHDVVGAKEELERIAEQVENVE
ncbi:MAG: YicC family protein [Gemmatimonadota bacterium]|nr:YicC family protein [Gemmatimonadota bacterium]